VCTTVGGVRQWLWRAVDEHGVMLDVLMQRHRATKAARTFLARLFREFHVPETIRTDKLARYGAAIRELPALQEVDPERETVVPTKRARKGQLSEEQRELNRSISMVRITVENVINRIKNFRACKEFQKPS